MHPDSSRCRVAPWPSEAAELHAEKGFFPKILSSPFFSCVAVWDVFRVSSSSTRYVKTVPRSCLFVCFLSVTLEPCVGHYLGV